jgi:hypothetical protein
VASGRWVVNDEINVLAEHNQAAVRAELVFPNVVFGLHRWYAGGSSPSRLAFASPGEWEAELTRGRAGDNLQLVSLSKVHHLALAHVGSATSDVAPIPTPAVEERLLGFFDNELEELAVVHRHVLDSTRLECSYDVIEAEDWADALERWSRLRGELYFFDDAKVVWGEDEPVSAYAPEARRGQHGHYVVDGYLPDSEGRIVIGGAY